MNEVLMFIIELNKVGFLKVVVRVRNYSSYLSALLGGLLYYGETPAVRI
jgi:hypothetical protein